MPASRRTRGPVYRCTTCDRCTKPKDDCIWVRPDVDGRRDEDWCMCGDCRKSVQAAGIPLVNIDVDFKDVAA